MSTENSFSEKSGSVATTVFVVGVLCAIVGIYMLLVVGPNDTKDAMAFERAIDIYAHPYPDDACKIMDTDMVGLAYRQITPWSVQLVCAGHEGVVELTQAKHGIAKLDWTGEHFYAYGDMRYRFDPELLKSCPAHSQFLGAVWATVLLGPHFPKSVSSGRPVCMDAQKGLLSIGEWFGSEYPQHLRSSAGSTQPGWNHIWSNVTPIRSIY